MKKICACLVVAASLAIAAPSAQPVTAPDIRLILLIAVDQFRYDYLTRFRSEYTDGFKQLLTQGAVFTNANLEHYPTVTAIGHATMLTGATPSVSGIIGNDWFDRESGATVTSVTDTGVKPLGSPTGSAASPAAAPGRHHWRRAEDGVAAGQGAPDKPRVFGVSLKDRSAILAVGRGADAAYWWDTKTGSFVTQHLLLRRAARVGAHLQRAEAGRRPCRRVVDSPRPAVDRARSSFRRSAARPSMTRSTAARTATSCSSISPASS